jgi:hypothetical protein
LLASELRPAYPVTRPVLTSASKTVEVNCRKVVVIVKIAARPVAIQFEKLDPAYMCQKSVCGAGAADRIIETVATFGIKIPGPSREILAIIEHAIPACTVIEDLRRRAAIAIDLVVQPASATFFQVLLLSAANHRKEM